MNREQELKQAVAYAKTLDVVFDFITRPATPKLRAENLKQVLNAIEDRKEDARREAQEMAAEMQEHVPMGDSN